MSPFHFPLLFADFGGVNAYLPPLPSQSSGNTA
jgi:hypothetical protein